eukprot:9493700-Lingulodinium_polyedra.AAC.1
MLAQHTPRVGFDLHEACFWFARRAGSSCGSAGRPGGRGHGTAARLRGLLPFVGQFLFPFFVLRVALP